MADDDAPLPQAHAQCRSVMGRVTGEDEIGLRRQHLEAQGLQASGHFFPGTDDPGPRLLEIGPIVDGRHGPDDGQPVEGIGVETVLDPLEALDQFALPHREPDPQPGQRPGFRQGVDDQQVGISGDQADGARPAEIDIGLVDDDHRIGVGRQDPFDRRQRQTEAGRGIGVGDDDPAVVPPVIVRIDGEVVFQRHQFMAYLVETAVYRVKAVGDVRKEQRFFVLEQAEKGVGEDLVGAVADKDLVERKAVIPGYCLPEGGGFRVGIEAQAVVGVSLDGGDGQGRRAIGVLIGIEFDQPVGLGLFAGHIGFEIAEDRIPETAHDALSLFGLWGVIDQLLFVRYRPDCQSYSDFGERCGTGSIR